MSEANHELSLFVRCTSSGKQRSGATREQDCAKASTTEEPDAGKLHVRDCAGGAGQPGSLRLKRHPPGNRLEALKDDRKGQHSIRINDQWRLCFVWTREGAADVEIVDYH